MENGLFVPTSVVNKKIINILQNALSMDEFFLVSQCTTTKQIWVTLVETHEGTAEVKRSRLNTLSQEYELFRMQQVNQSSHCKRDLYI